MVDKKTWDQAYRNQLTPWRRENIDMAGWLKQSGINSGTALDLGCGTGEYSIWLAEHGFGVEGLDFSSEAMAIARQKSDKPNFEFWNLEDLEHYKFKHNKYDLILDVKTFVFIKNKKKYLKEIMLRLKGVFILEVFLRNDEKPALAINEKRLKDFLNDRFITIKKIPHQKLSLEFAEYYLKSKT